jgi:hypothetical protein
LVDKEGESVKARAEAVIVALIEAAICWLPFSVLV